MTLKPDVNEMQLRVEAALLRLSSTERELLCLVTVRGLSYRDAAEVLGIGPRTAAVGLKAALGALRFDPAFVDQFTPH